MGNINPEASMTTKQAADLIRALIPSLTNQGAAAMVQTWTDDQVINFFNSLPGSTRLYRKSK